MNGLHGKLALFLKLNNNNTLSREKVNNSRQICDRIAFILAAKTCKMWS